MAVAAVVDHDILEYFPGPRSIDDVCVVAQHEGDPHALTAWQRGSGTAGSRRYAGAGPEKRH
jgi:hypothetical protein